jgi:large subunit ribosomal protein L15
MKVHELKVTGKSSPKRVGRGISAGQGKTAGRGTKGQNSRTGGGTRMGFEGGQNPLAKRLPKKRGFTPISRTVYQVVKVEALSKLKGSNVDITDLYNAGLVSRVDRPVKLLSDGEISSKLTIQVQAASAGAKAKIEKAGGKVELVELPRPLKEAKDKA